MRIERRQNVRRNVLFGLTLKIYQVLVPFVMRTAIIYYMGVEYLGLSGLFVSILQILNMAELGVGSAMVFSMYEPIAKDETDKICALIHLYRLYYRVIGCFIAAAGIMITPLIPKLIHGMVPEDVNIYVLYLLNLSGTVATYWFLAYKNSIFLAHQRTDIGSKISLVTNSCQYIFQLWSVVVLKNYYLYIISSLCAQLINNVITALAAAKYYPDYKPTGRLPDEKIREINQRIKDLVTSKIGGTILLSADTIVISVYMGLTALAVYQNYYFILSAVIGFVEIIFAGSVAGIGNSLITETNEKNYKDLNKFTFLLCWLTGICFCCFMNLYQPFMEVWMGKELMLDFFAVICFCVYFWVYELNRLLNTYKDAGGIWHQDRYRPLITSMVNLALNLIMVRLGGIYGVLLSTVIATSGIGIPWILHNLFTSIFEKKRLKKYFFRLIMYTAVTAVAGAISFQICHFISFRNPAALFFRALTCCIIPNLIFWAAYHRLPEFRQSVYLLKNMVKAGGKSDNNS